MAGSVEVSPDELLCRVEEAVRAGEVVRLSGGDPVAYPDIALQLLRACKELGEVGSVARNGSSAAFVESVLPYADFVALDLKGATPEELARRAGLSGATAGRAFAEAVAAQSLASKAGVLVDPAGFTFID